MQESTYRRLTLTLVWSVVVEVVFCLVTGFAWLPAVWWCFHYPAYFLMFGWLDPESGSFWHAILWWLFMFSAGVFQWWLIFLAGSWVFRHFRRKHDTAV